MLVKSEEPHQENQTKSERRRHPEYGPWDRLGLPIREMVYWTNDYVVYVDDKINIDFRIEKQIPKADIPKFNRILNSASVLEASISKEFPESISIESKLLIGDAIACCFDGDYENAAAMLGAAGTFIQARRHELSRMWFASACCLFALPIVLVECLVWLMRAPVKLAVGEAVFWLMLCAGAGALGAVLSAISRSGTLQFDASSGRVLHSLEGAFRVIAGGISGIVVGVAVKSGFVLATPLPGEKANFLMLLLALAAGAGERFAPSMLSNIGLLEASSGRDAGISPRIIRETEGASSAESARKRGIQSRS